MASDLLSADFLKSLNPGMTDFGTGNILTMTGSCLRAAKLSTDCRVCLDSCPADGLSAQEGQRPYTNSNCLKCGLCVSLCPTNALAATSKTVQLIIRLFLQYSLRTELLTITCNRTFAVLKLERESSEPAEARARLKALDRATLNETLLTVPCMAMLSKELWFVILNEIGVSNLRRLHMLLSSEQCDLCPVNSLGNVPNIIEEAKGMAESWAAQSVKSISVPNEMPSRHFSSVRDYLVGESEVDRRGVFTGFVEELVNSWSSTQKVGNRVPDETLRNQRRKESVQTTLLADDLKDTYTGVDKPTLSAFRLALVEALGRNPSNANRVRLLVSETVGERCDSCGECLKACPIHARRQAGDDRRREGDASRQAGDTHQHEGDTDQHEGGAVFTDALYCMGCSACIQACPQEAIVFIQITGEAFLRKQPS